MKENKNIDRLFQEKFKDFEAHPSDRVWEAIAASQKQNPKAMSLWWRVAGIAAMFVILFTVGGLFLNSDPSQTPQIVLQETSDDSKTITPLTEKEQDLIIEDETTSTLVENNTISNTKNLENNSKASSAQKQASSSQITQKQYAVTNGGSSYNSKVTIVKNEVADDTVIQNDAIAYSPNTAVTTEKEGDPTTNVTNTGSNLSNDDKNTQENNIDGISIAIITPQDDLTKKDLTVEAQKIKENKNNEAVAQIDEKVTSSKWDVGAVAAPVYYGDFGGSGLDKQFADNDKSGDVNLSYGVQVSYEVSPKLKVRTGLNTLDLSYATNGISFSTSAARSLDGSSFADNIQTLVFSDANTGESTNSFAPQNRNANSSDGSLEQRLNYFEIPMEAVYTISDKRIGLSVIGGVSTLLLNENQVILLSDELTTDLGTSTSVNGVSFSTNIGVGIDYKMTDKLKLNVEPSFKYQLNGFDNNVVDFKPYYLGVYTGVSYKF